MEMKDAEIYLEEYHKHRENGDDPMNARLRIIEQGCPPETAMQIQEACGDGDDEETDA